MRRKKLTAKVLALSLAVLTAASSLTACGASETSASASISKDYNSIDESATSDALVGLTGAGYQSNNSVEMEEKAVDIEEQANEVTSTESTSESTSESNNQVQQDVLYEDKLIYKCNLKIETLSFDETYNQLQSLITKYDGRIQSEDFHDQEASYYSEYSSTYSGDRYTKGKNDVLVIRIPSNKYKEFMQESGELLGNVISKSQTIDNITQKYYDTTAQVNGLEAQLKRLEEMMASTSDIEAMIKINSEITSVQSQINELKTVIRTMDMDTTYSYVYMTLTEVVEYSEAYTAEKTNTFFDRLKNTCKDTWERFLESCENLLFGLIRLIPTIAIIVIIVLIAKVFFWKKIKKRVNSNTTLSEAAELLSYKESTEVEETQKEKKDETK